jgi:hypothetical protein
VEPGSGQSPSPLHPDLDKVQCNHEPEEEKQYSIEDEEENDNNRVWPEVGVPG